MLPVAMAQSFSGSIATVYVLPLFRMYSYNWPMSMWHYCSSLATILFTSYHPCCWLHPDLDDGGC